MISLVQVHGWNMMLFIFWSKLWSKLLNNLTKNDWIVFKYYISHSRDGCFKPLSAINTMILASNGCCQFVYVYCICLCQINNCISDAFPSVWLQLYRLSIQLQTDTVKALSKASFLQPSNQMCMLESTQHLGVLLLTPRALTHFGMLASHALHPLRPQNCLSTGLEVISCLCGRLQLQMESFKEDSDFLKTCKTSFTEPWWED